MFEYLVYEHVADLRRAAAAYHRAASRNDRARPGAARRVIRRAGLSRGPVPLGCQA